MSEKKGGLFKMFESTGDDFNPGRRSMSSKNNMSKVNSIFKEVVERLEDKEKIAIQKGVSEIAIGVSGTHFELTLNGYDTFMYHIGCVDNFQTEHEENAKWFGKNSLVVKNDDLEQIKITLSNSNPFRHILIRAEDSDEIKNGDKGIFNVYDVTNQKVLTSLEVTSQRDNTIYPCFKLFYIYFSTQDGIWRIVPVNTSAEKISENDILSLKQKSEEVQHPRLPISFVEKPTTLNVKIIKVTDINIKDQSKCDPFCYCYVGNQKLKTKMVKGTNSPSFEEQLNFKMPETFLKEIKIELWNGQKKDEFLGQIVLPSARALFNKKFTAKLKPRTGKEKDEDAHIKGSIEFILDYNKDEVVEISIFGVDLCKVMERHQETENIPRQIKPLFEYLTKHGPGFEGIFRISGSKEFIDTNIQKMDQGEFLPLDSKNIEDLCHNVSSILKKYIRDLPSPLLTYELYEEFLKTCGLEDDEKIETLKKLLTKIPVEHYNLLIELLIVCAAVEAKKDSNKMTAENLAVVFGIGILKHKDELKTTMDVAQIQKVFISLLHFYSKIFTQN